MRQCDWNCWQGVLKRSWRNSRSSYNAVNAVSTTWQSSSGSVPGIFTTCSNSTIYEQRTFERM